MPHGTVIAAFLALSGVSQDQSGAIGRKPPAALPTYFSSSDYPKEALRHREQGKVGFRVTVGVDGRVAACAITSSSGSRALDETTCRLAAERFHFRPAMDAAGTRVQDWMDLSVMWVLPKKKK